MAYFMSNKKKAVQPAAAKSGSSRQKLQLRSGFLIHDVSRLRRTIYDQRLKEYGITRSQWWVLANLSRHGEGVGYLQVELARILDVGKVTLGGLIDRLEINGVVARVPDLTDRRAKRIVMTEKGKSLLHKVEQVGVLVNKDIMAGISPAEEDALVDVLGKMKQNLIAMNAVPGRNDDLDDEESED
jgi:MarR family transcriptional regulator, transcriptional regulator for hemolysin